MSDASDRARIVAPPPLLALACIVAGFVAEHFKPLPLLAKHRAIQIVIGVALLILSAAIIFVATRQFLAHGTHPNPYRPVKALVVDGIYKFSRNPIYVAVLLVVIAFALCVNSRWFLVATVILFFLLHFGVIRREERYLSHKFGNAYDNYRRRVRRWI
jgi:protein-S-isoprenylcysteine O-methyltransferase Ste14